MDEAERIDLALNGDFDSTLFDCWDVAVKQGGEEAVGGDDDRGLECRDQDNDDSLRDISDNNNNNSYDLVDDAAFANQDNDVDMFDDDMLDDDEDEDEEDDEDDEEDECDEDHIVESLNHSYHPSIHSLLGIPGTGDLEGRNSFTSPLSDSLALRRLSSAWEITAASSDFNRSQVSLPSFMMMEVDDAQPPTPSLPSPQQQPPSGDEDHPELGDESYAQDLSRDVDGNGKGDVAASVAAKGLIEALQGNDARPSDLAGPPESNHLSSQSGMSELPNTETATLPPLFTTLHAMPCPSILANPIATGANVQQQPYALPLGLSMSMGMPPFASVDPGSNSAGAALPNTGSLIHSNNLLTPNMTTILHPLAATFLAFQAANAAAAAGTASTCSNSITAQLHCPSIGGANGPLESQSTSQSTTRPRGSPATAAVAFVQQPGSHMMTSTAVDSTGTVTPASSSHHHASHRSSRHGHRSRHSQRKVEGSSWMPSSRRGSNIHTKKSRSKAAKHSSQVSSTAGSDSAAALSQHGSSPHRTNHPNLPPFLLFDAPLELRTNFINCQRAHGLPILEDNNTIHYNLHTLPPPHSMSAINTTSSATMSNSSSRSNGNQRLQSHHGAASAANTSTSSFAPIVSSAYSNASISVIVPAMTAASMPIPRLMDARHGNIGNKRLKNAKEQKRAQKITELIEQLRCNMEKGGWNVGLKSKFHTLSSCADYVKHLVQINKEKEDAIKKTKCDLDVKRTKLEEDKAQQQDPSDPESTTSSLTVSSESAREGNKISGNAPTAVGGSDNQNINNSSIPHKSSSITTAMPVVDPDSANDGEASSCNPSQSTKGERSFGSDQKTNQSSASGDGDDLQYNNNSSIDSCYENSKRRDRSIMALRSLESTLSSGCDDSGVDACSGADGGSTDVASGDHGVNPRPSVHSLSVQTHSTVSDVTDSNQGSKRLSTSIGVQRSVTNNGIDPDSAPTAKHRNSLPVEGSMTGGGPVNDGSVSSDAAVASKTLDDHFTVTRASQSKSPTLMPSTSHVVVKGGRKRKTHLRNTEITSLDENFELDYEEVFLKSHVPQVLASISGKIIAWNEVFLKATGLTKEEVDRLTIFSLVRQNELSEVFAIVATALRTGTMKVPGPMVNNSIITEPITSWNEESLPNRNEEIDSTSDANTKDEPAGEDIVIDSIRSASDEKSAMWNYSAITFPCADFRSRPRDDGDQKKFPLNITITLMKDDDPRKRCFHCVFTDCPGTNGALGSITPDLMALLFTTSKSKHKSSTLRKFSGKKVPKRS